MSGSTKNHRDHAEVRLRTAVEREAHDVPRDRSFASRRPWLPTFHVSGNGADLAVCEVREDLPTKSGLTTESASTTTITLALVLRAPG